MVLETQNFRYVAYFSTDYTIPIILSYLYFFESADQCPVPVN
jgi:hypothetical protein